jgi:hypothetical protein
MKTVAMLLLTCVSAAAAPQTLSADQKKAIREVIGIDSAKETEELVNSFLKAAKKEKPTATADELQKATEGIEFVQYNKAYNQYRCILEHPTSPEQGQECALDANRNIAIYLKLTNEYSSTIANRSARCEMKTRLFKAEIEFPPYPFMGDAQLFDHGRMIECLRQ